MKAILYASIFTLALSVSYAAHAEDENPLDTTFGALSADMSCEDIQNEVVKANAVIDAANDAKTNGAIADAGTTAAVHGAAYAGAGSAIPFLGGIMNAVSSVTAISSEAAEEKAAEAKSRKDKLAGMSAAKGCGVL